jgi:hypothetical protein
MKIRALRLSDVGSFRTPTALEGLTGGLDVLTGPNELGKSTIFRALQAVFLKKHNSTSITDIQSRSGGDPQIEAEFEAAGRTWRITKRFGRSRSRMAELIDLGARHTVAKGAEADERVFELIGAKERFGLLWVRQDPAQLRWQPDKEKDQVRTLETAIESEIMSVADGTEMSRVRQRICELLDAQTTPSNRQRARTGSSYIQALKRQNEIESALAVARAAEQDMSARLDERVRLQSRHQELSAAEHAQTLATTLADAERQLDEARRAQTLHAQARESASQAQLARKALTDLDRGLTELAELTAAAEQDAVSSAHATANVEEAVRVHSIAVVVLGEASQDERRLQTVLTAISAAETASLQRRRLAELEARLAEAREAAAAAVDLERQLSAHKVTRSRLTAIEREERAAMALRARLDAALPSMTVDYLPNPTGTIRLGGRALDGGRELRIDRPLVLDIEGIGRITVVPGGSADLEVDAQELRARELQLAALLKDSGTADADAARCAHQARIALEQRLSEARARVSALAPEGPDALATAIDNLRAALPHAVASPDQPSRSEVEAQLGTVQSRLSDLQQAVEQAARALERARGEAKEIEGSVKSRAARRATLEQQLPPPPVRAEERARLAAAADVTAAAAAAADQAARLLAASPPSDRDVASLTEAKAQAAAAVKRHREEVEALSRRIERLDGELEQSFRDGGGRRVAELEGELQAATAEVRAFEDDLAALRLLSEEIEAAEQARRDHFLKPVTTRLHPYLAELFPGARAGFGGGLSLETVERNGLAEMIGDLSGGTQEQIAVMVRLAFARLLADTGAAAPVVLDDALVYSDDERIARVFGALEQASRYHQVIVLTCRSQSFARLGGTRLVLAPWQQAA